MPTPVLYNLVRAARAFRLRLLDLITTGYYRLVCASFGQGARVGWGSWIAFPHRVEIGDFVAIGRDVAIGTESPSARMLIGDHVQINDAVSIDFTGDLQLKEWVLVSEGAVIYTHSHGRDPRSDPVGFSKVVGRHAWIGARAIVMHGCLDVGESAIVGAGVIVTRSISKGAVVVSAQARPVS